MKYSSFIKDIRIKRGISMRTVSKQLGIPLWLYWYYETHMRYITTDMVKSIFNALNVKYEVA